VGCETVGSVKSCGPSQRLDELHRIIRMGDHRHVVRRDCDGGGSHALGEQNTDRTSALRTVKSLRGAHVRPGVLLHGREHLLEVVAIVVHPLVQQIGNRDVADLGVLAAAL
jgi:hypothetical protein